MEEYLSFLPPPAPPLPVRVWKDKIPRMRCLFCKTFFSVEKGAVKCPKCGASYIVGEWSWQSFFVGLALGLIIGLVISIAVYYFVIMPRMPLVQLAAALREFLRA